MGDSFVLYWVFRYNFAALFASAFATLLAAAYLLRSWRVFVVGFVILSFMLGARVMFEIKLHESALQRVTHTQQAGRRFFVNQVWWVEKRITWKMN